MAAPWGNIGVVLNAANDSMDFPIAHAINTFLSRMSNLNGVVREYPLQWLLGMAWAFSSQNPATAGLFEAFLIGRHNMDMDPIIAAINTAFNAGFSVTGVQIAAGETFQMIGSKYLSVSIVWARKNRILLRLGCDDFYPGYA